MNTTHKRRGRRSLAAILAAMLMASVLAVVAGSPAQAANTSGEALVDTNDDGVGDAREFGGRDRYDTALRLAENFATGRGGLGGVPTAFVASGVSLVDAVSVSGLAGFLDAPVLLTPADSLNGRVADFLEDYGVGTVYVLGGSAAVADSVLEDMEALANEPTVTRIEGQDRYATAAAIASELGGSGSWCGGEDVAAILANGGDVSLAGAMMVGPVAHRLQLPVLLTAADELPSATTDFIEAEDVEHVVIIGGTDSVSDDVESALTDAGVDNIERIAGDTPAATSVAIAELMTGDCAADLAPVSVETVALVHRDALPDGVTAAPVLASTYANSGDLVPMLIVGDTLPASVRDYLAATDAEYANGDKINLSIVAIGGTAVISDSVMEAATAAAVSEDQLTVKISGSPEDPDWPLSATDKRGTVVERAAASPAITTADPGRTFWLHFSDDIATKDVETKIRDILEVNGAPARLGALGADVDGYDAPTRMPIQHHTGGGNQCSLDIIQVTLLDDAPLKEGDTVSITDSSIKLGDNDDERDVVPASVTVPTTPPDTTNPNVNILALVGQPGFIVSFDDWRPKDLDNTRDEDRVRDLIHNDADNKAAINDIVFSAAGDNEILPSSIEELTDADGDGNAAIADIKRIFRINPHPLHRVRAYRVMLGVDEDGVQMTLERRDRITVKNAVFEDGFGNRNRSVTQAAILPPTDAKVTSVRMSQPKYTVGVGRVQSHMALRIPDAVAGGDGETAIIAADSQVWITANADGAAAGAAGNDWSFVFDKASTWDADNDLDIDVRVNSRDKTVSVRFDDDAWVLVFINDNAADPKIGEASDQVSTDNELLNDDSQTRIVVSTSVQ
ncbi:cell wall-binding repeat-containing protein [Candidatus Poriferisodalis sp.]|uniref:cell wall-binding repeat-containing protein n=1 Tax=Candidatus Poriferisodalis sp. TaxID=3101277 RepID=UPI003B5215FF